MEAYVSVIIPVFNVKKYLDRCVESVINQSYSDLEIILVDDGSTDGSDIVCDNWKKRDDRIKIIHKSNGGLGFARNTGIENANGKYILFIDSDDYIDKDMIETLVKDSNAGEVDVCYSDFYRDYGEYVVANGHLKGYKGKYKNEEVLNKIIPWMVGGLPDDPNDEIIGWGVWKSLYKKELIDNHGILFHSEREVISEDIIFQLDYLSHVNSVSINEKAFYHYCLRNGSLSAEYRSDRREKNVVLYKAILQRLRSLGIEKQNILRADRMLIASARVNIMMASSALNFWETISVIKEYETDINYQKIIRRYPAKKLPIKQRIFLLCMKYKLNVPLYIITKEYTRRKM